MITNKQFVVSLFIASVIAFCVGRFVFYSSPKPVESDSKQVEVETVSDYERFYRDKSDEEDDSDFAQSILKACHQAKEKKLENQILYDEFFVMDELNSCYNVLLLNKKTGEFSIEYYYVSKSFYAEMRRAQLTNEGLNAPPKPADFISDETPYYDNVTGENWYNDSVSDYYTYSEDAKPYKGFKYDSKRNIMLFVGEVTLKEYDPEMVLDSEIFLK